MWDLGTCPRLRARGGGGAVLCLGLGLMGLMGLSGCHGGWGHRSLPLSGLKGERIYQSARDAFWDPQTLVPLTGAIVFSLDDFDERGSQWALKHRPLFKTARRATQASDDYVAVLAGEALVTALICPVDAEQGPWLRGKSRQWAVDGITVGTTYAAIEGLKKGFGRTGPDGWKETSMPSGHASGAFLFSSLSNRKLDALVQNATLRVPLQITNIALAASVGWARVEGGHHYPSDVLAGAALGHFMAHFLQDAFNGSGDDSTVALALNPTRSGGAVTLGIRF